jgi:hypothetical protein
MSNVWMIQRDLPLFWATLAVPRLDAKFPSAATADALSNHCIYEASNVRNTLDAVGKAFVNPQGVVGFPTLSC